MTTPVPAPATFDSLGIPATLLAAIAARGLAAPTQVQSLVSDAALTGSDLLVSSQTGSGKTLAFGILLAREILGADGTTGGHAKIGRSPLGLVVAPTRELAVQVARELSWLFEKSRAVVQSVTGGSDARDEMRKLHRGCDIVVATPGRLGDHLTRRNIDLKHVKVAVLDEADEMLDLGFREELEKILSVTGTPEERRTHLFSATLPPPILALARTYQRNAKRVSAGTPGGAAHQDIEFHAHLFAPGQQEAAVVNVLRKHESPAAIVFTRTRAGAAALADALVKRGFEATSISGDLTQTERTRALNSLRDGRSRVLVATDVAARGLDLPEVGLVVHADPPGDPDGITHRSGRTGRAGKKGVSVLLAPRALRAKVERLVRAAGVKGKWEPLPTAEEIEKADRERIALRIAAEAREAAGDTDELVDRLLRELPVRDLVAALLRRTAASLPEPMTVTTVVETHPARERERERDRGPERGPRGPRDARPERPREERSREEGPGPRPPRTDKAEAGWKAFRINVGHERNAEPRWLLPLICRRGGVTGGDVGRIRIRDRSTTFEIREEVAPSFAEKSRRPDPDDPGVRIEAELSLEELAKRSPFRSGAAAGPVRPERRKAPSAPPPEGERRKAAAPRPRPPASRPTSARPKHDAPRGKKPLSRFAKPPHGYDEGGE